MIDLHTHILPGVDDGPATLEEAIAMIRVAAANGTTDLVATPHADSAYAFDWSGMDARIHELEEASGRAVRIHSGCELHLDARNILEVLEHPLRCTIAGGPYLLTELPGLFLPVNLESIFSQFRDRGVIPVIAHPERNSILHHQIPRVESWVEAGCCVQITAQSLLGHFGRAAQRCAADLLDRCLVHFVASDAHDSRVRPPDLTEAFAWVAARYGNETADRLFVINPSSTLASGLIQAA